MKRYASNHSLRWVITLLLLTILPTDARSQATSEQPSATEKNQFDFIDHVIQQHLNENQLVGAVTWVAQNGKVIHLEAHGLRNRELESPMQTDSIFRVHSFTKAIATSAAMMLWEEGKFQLDDPVAKYLPEFADQKVYDSAESRNPTHPMTVRDLMRHTSGVISPNENGNEVEKLWAKSDLRNLDTSLEEFSHRVAKLPLEFQPSERWKYGMSIDVLGRLIEVWSGQVFEDFLRTRFFLPLNMKDTDFFVPPEKLGRLATLYELDSQGKLSPNNGMKKDQPFYVPTKSPTRCSPGGGLFSTASDYGTFLQMLLAGGELKGQRFLKAETIVLMSSDNLPANVPGVVFGNEFRDSFKFGLGFNVITALSQWDRHARVGEYGWGGAASCHYWLYPPQDLIVITLEATRPYNRNLEQSLKGRIYKALDQ